MPALFLITHADIGEALLKNAQTIMPDTPIQTHLLSITPDQEIGTLEQAADQIMQSFSHPHGVLLLTDLSGATPAHIAMRQLKYPNTALISGLNLAILLKVMNYADLPLDELLYRAQEGGIADIRAITYTEYSHTHTSPLTAERLTRASDA
jgi:PTS system ascorbate-specific IIA component